MSWTARNKTDLIIEVWEKLDCENIGAAEIEAIETVVGDVYGPEAVDSPMAIARLLADEGAELRHSEIMQLYVERASKRPYDAALRNIVNFSSLRTTLASIRNLENLRKKFAADGDKHGLRYVRETAIRGKNDALDAANKAKELIDKLLYGEAADWLTIWLQTPEMFETWVAMRQRSPDFLEKFGNLDPEN
jgi:hypothetical protein